MTNETMELMEQAVQERLKNDEGLVEGDELYNMKETVSLIEQMNVARQTELDALDKEERRKLEREKNETLIRVEKEKQKITFARAALEMAKIVVPSVISVVAYSVFQKRVLIFEKTGRVCSTAGRELHMPKFMK